MSLERWLRLVAGSFVLISLALAEWVSPYWLIFTALVGLNLLQSAFTNWCPVMALLRRLGRTEEGDEEPSICRKEKANVSGTT